jgi:predicted O-methyltransferase YrrM
VRCPLPRYARQTRQSSDTAHGLHRERGIEEATISVHDDSSALRAGHVAEDEVLVRARRQAEQAGAAPIPAPCGAALRFLAAAIGARAVVELGTGAGVSGVWILRGMRGEGILTTVDAVPERQELARAAYADAGFPANRGRVIPGRSGDVLPRLTDSAYDMVLFDADPAQYPEQLPEALRVLRTGGVLVANGASMADRTGDGPLAAPDAATTGIRALTRLIHEDESLLPLLIPVGDGLLAAIKQG